MGFLDKLKSATKEAIKSTGSALGFEKLKDGMRKTREAIFGNLAGVFGAGKKIDQAALEEIEDILIMADVGVAATDAIVEKLKEKIKAKGDNSSEFVYDALKETMIEILTKPGSETAKSPFEIDENAKPLTILIAGVNGVGKTTTIGKLAYNYINAGKKVIIGAADTFRAAANEQLEIWAERAGAQIVKQKQGADPAAVAYDALNSAVSKGFDAVLIDTAGRLHNKSNLMAELGKINRVLKKIKSSAPEETFLVLDATTGQNAIRQAEEFSKYLDLTGIVLTKLDGTAKGGVIFPIVNELNIPVKFIGVGEKIDNLQPFDPKLFVEALFATGSD